MTYFPDHRVDHAPEAECDGCRSTDSRAVVEAPRADSYARAAFPLRPDLVIQPGTNRK
jgi:hypothetical protein